MFSGRHFILFMFIQVNAGVLLEPSISHVVEALAEDLYEVKFSTSAVRAIEPCTFYRYTIVYVTSKILYSIN